MKKLENELKEGNKMTMNIYDSSFTKASAAKAKRRKKLVVIVSILIVMLFGFLIYDNMQIGRELDSYRGVAVYYNGIIYIRSHGQHFSGSGYYYGFKWQCVEHVKRFYYQALGHEMPDVFGHAKDFFDPSVAQGQLNTSRGLIQYRNGGDVSPRPDDLLVFTDRRFGHVAIITYVTDSYVEIIQQNIFGRSRERLPLRIEGDQYFIGNRREPAGWLRLDPEGQ